MFTRGWPGGRGGLAKVNINTSLAFKVKDVENKQKEISSPEDPAAQLVRDGGGASHTHTRLSEDSGRRLQCRSGDRVGDLSVARQALPFSALVTHIAHPQHGGCI